MTMNGQDKIYSIVTDRILESLEKGVVPWKKSWDSSFSLPVNLKSGKAYRGSNILVLLCSGFQSKYWLTFKQARELGGIVKIEERGTPITFWNFLKSEEGSSKESSGRAFLKYYTVFNISQCEGISPPPEPEGKDSILPLSSAEEIVKSYPPTAPVIINGANASYNHKEDIVRIPQLNSFSSAEEYYSTLFHELVHSTGHSSRIDRQLNGKRDNDLSSKEELIAEIGSAFLCAVVGISNEMIENQSSYIAGWVKALKNDNKLLLTAGSKAQKAVDFILNEKEKEKE